MKGVFIVVCALIALCCWGFDDIDNDIDDRKFVSYDIHMKVNTETDFFVENQFYHSILYLFQISFLKNFQDI